MSVLCCCRPRREENEDVASYPPQPTTIPLPVLPPPAKLSDARLCESLTPNSVGHLQPNLRQGTAISLQSLGAASSNPSLMPNHESIELGELVVEDSDSEVGPTETPVDNKKGSSPLDVVRTKFTRSRSHHGSKRSPRASLGSSGEEMARRAELKRIMHKRIQDELKCEEEQPEPSQESTSSAKHPATPIEFPGRGPRDHLEFSMVDASVPDAEFRKSTADKQQKVTNENNQDDKGTGNTLDRRRSSCPQAFTFSTPGGLATQVVLRERNSLPDIPPSPGICPLKQFDIQNAPSLNSRPLSVSACQLDQVPDANAVPLHQTPSRHDSSPDGNSALRTWLMTQGLSSREQSIGKLTEPVINSTPLTTVGVGALQQSVAKDGSDLQALYHLYALELAQRPLGEDSPDCPLAASDSLPKDMNSLEGMRVSGVPTLGADASSSNYPSMGSTRLPTPRVSTADSEIRHATMSLHGLQLSPFRWLGSGGDFSMMDSDYLACNNGSSHSLAVPTTRGSRRPTAGPGSSLAVSETSSYRHREAELKTIEKRFGDVLSKGGRPPPKHSKFREDFEETGPPVAITRSSFLLQKLHIPVPKRVKSGSKTDAQITPQLDLPPEIPITGSSRGNAQSQNQASDPSGRSSLRTPSPNLYLTPTLEESATDLWQRAVQLERESREVKARAAAAETERKKLASNGSVHLKAGRWRGARRSKSLESTSVSEGITPNINPVTAKDDLDFQAQAEPPSSLARKLTARALQDEETKGGLKNSVNPQGEGIVREPHKFVQPPEAWSKWPSQTRAERTATAGYSDNMRSKDFAIVASTHDGRTEWITDKGTAAARTGLQLGSRSFSGKLSKVVKTGLEKLLPPRSRTVDEAGRSLNGHAVFVGRRLEYPELEILPTEGGYKELKALEQGIGIMKNRQPPPPTTTAPTTNMRKPSMSRTIPILVRAAEHESHGCTIEDSRVSRVTPMAAAEIQARPVTPARYKNRNARDSVMSNYDYFATPPTSRLQARRTRDSTLTTGTTERYATPRSRMSRSPSLRSPSNMSTMSNRTVVRRCKSATEPMSELRYFSTCKGRSVTQPEMLESTKEFEEELDRRLEIAKSETFATARSSIDAACSEHTLPPL